MSSLKKYQVSNPKNGFKILNYAKVHEILISRLLMYKYK